MTDEELAMAYADGELDAISAKRLERRMAEEPALAAAVEAQRALRARVAAAFAPIVAEAVPERLAAAARSTVVPLTPRPRSPVRWQQAAALAACLVIGAMVGRFAGPQPPVSVAGGELAARGALAHALDTQLASDAADTRIVASFRDRDGSYCRLFSAPALRGIACRDGSNWALRQTAGPAAHRTADYRQAASGDPKLMAAAQDMMAGDPLGPQAERRARDAGWR